MACRGFLSECRINRTLNKRGSRENCRAPNIGSTNRKSLPPKIKITLCLTLGHVDPYSKTTAQKKSRVELGNQLESAINAHRSRQIGLQPCSVIFNCDHKRPRSSDVSTSSHREPARRDWRVSASNLSNQHYVQFDDRLRSISSINAIKPAATGPS